jgi:putative transposase
LLARVPDWAALLAGGMEADALASIRERERTGRPLGDDAFVARLGASSGRDLRPPRRGRPPTRDSLHLPD